MDAISSITLPASLESLDTFLRSTVEAAAASHVSPEKVARLEVALEEGLVNVINYAYKDESGEIRLTYGLEPSAFVVEIRDRGPEFDVLDAEAPDLDSDIEDRGVGGLGIFLMRKFVDEVTYRREGENNVLVLKIRKEALQEL